MSILVYDEPKIGSAPVNTIAEPCLSRGDKFYREQP